LLKAVESRDIEMIETLLSHGAEIKKRFSTPLAVLFLTSGEIQRGGANYREKTLLLSRYRRKIFSTFLLHALHLYYRPPGPGFYRAAFLS